MAENIYPRHNPAIICGIMTGTSLDGIDLAFVKFNHEYNSETFELLFFNTLPYPEVLKNSIADAIDCKLTTDKISQLNFEIAQSYYNAITSICEENKFSLKNLTAIGMHGQTIWHQPPVSSQSIIPSTLQLGSGPALASLTNIPVVYDFRAADIALGGQGVPLVPIFDFNFLKSTDKNRIILNIGGISNITFLPASCKAEQVIAFDTGPGNVWIDAAMKILFNRNYDSNGEIASKGVLIKGFLDDLKAVGFIFDTPPKSTGRELFTIDKLKLFLTQNISAKPEDIIFTITFFTAWSIAENIRLYAPKAEELVYSGGGALNITLISMLKNELPGVKFYQSDSIGILSDAKEAICFAYLAWRTLRGLPGNLPSVTGAKKEAILGSIAPVIKFFN